MRLISSILAFSGKKEIIGGYRNLDFGGSIKIGVLM